MIETIASVDLMLSEAMKIKKNHLAPDILTGKEKRLCLVSGIYGDELQGQYICYEVIRRIKKDFSFLTGIVDIYPDLNPLALEAGTREIPGSELDMNELFPGVRGGAASEYVARCVVDDIRGKKDEKKADFCLDIHGSDLYLHEIPQIRMDAENVDGLMPYAGSLNTDMVWIHPSRQVKSGSLCYELNRRGVLCCITESSYAFHIDQAYCKQIVEGIFALMKKMGIWQGECIHPKRPIVARDDQIAYLNSETSGIFIPHAAVHDEVYPGEKIGEIVSVITGSVEQVIISPVRGMISAMRQYPVIEVGSLLCRIVEKQGE